MMKASLCVALLFHCCSAFVPYCSTLSALPPATGCSSTAATAQSVRYTGSSRGSSTASPRRLPRWRQLASRCSRAHDSTLGALRMSAAGDGDSSSSSSGEEPGEKGVGEGETGEQLDPRLYAVRISRVTGIEWGTDISFSWVFVRELQPSGAAAQCGEVSVGDQLIAINDINLVGSSFDAAMDAMMGLKGPDVEFTLFRGSKDDLKDLVGAEDPPAEFTVTVKQKGKPDVSLKAPSGTNLRNLLTDNGINVYQSITRWTNCKGKQLCGTCIVEINDGLESCTVRSLDESSTLRDNPANYRLSCVTDMYDDVTVTVFPPIGAAQWTR